MLLKKDKKKGALPQLINANRVLVVIVALCLADCSLVAYGIINAYASNLNTTDTGVKNDGVSLQEDSTQVSYLKYTLNSAGNALTVASWDSDKFPATGVVQIPNTAEYNGTSYPVEALGNSCFKNCKTLSSVSIPNSVTLLDDSCFFGCTSLSSITVPNSITSLGDSCFSGCTSLSSVSISNDSSSLNSLGDSCFSGCTSLSSISIPNSATSLGNNCFSGCIKLKSIPSLGNVSSIGDSCFSDCTSFLNIIIPNSVTSLGNSCFYNCTSLSSVSIPNSVTSLSNSCFYNCTSLSGISVPNSVTSLGNSCFSGCTSLLNISIPNDVTSLGDSCFRGCTSLSTINISSNSIKQFGSKCFYRCTSLSSISIPNSVTSLGDSCFSNCTSLLSITIPNNITLLDDNCFSSCTSLSSISIPSNVEQLGYECLSSCSKLTEIIFESPTNIAACRSDAFEKGPADRKYIFEGKIPDVVDSATDVTYDNSYLRVKFVCDKEGTIIKDVKRPASGTTTAVTPPSLDSNSKGEPFKKWSSYQYKTISNSGMIITAEYGYISLTDSAIKATVDSQTYTGSQIKPSAPDITIIYQPDVDADPIELANGTDYKIIDDGYGENINVSTGGTIKVEGTGRFNTAYTINFTITPKDIEASTQISPIPRKTYTGSAILLDDKELGVIDIERNKNLAKDTDYTVAYSDNTNAGTATVTFTGQGNYTGSTNTTFEIKAKDFTNGISVEPIPDQTYTGQSIDTIEIVVTDDAIGKVLEKDTDYTVAYSDNTNAGTATVIITGKGNYAGSISTTFEIKAKDLKSSINVFPISDQTYTGFAIDNVELLVVDKVTGDVLAEDTDYTLFYADNINVGKATITITGTGNYLGNVEVQFNILSKNIVQANIEPISDQTYTGSPILFSDNELVVIDSERNKSLTKGTDYTLTYSDNINVGKATITIAGMGNYSGSKTVEFNITAKNFEAGISIEPIPDQTYTGQPIDTIEPVVVDETTGKPLEKDTDYTVSYSDNTDTGTATVTITGKGNYAGSISTTFEIKAEDFESGVTIAPVPNQPYTGFAVEPELVITNNNTHELLEKGVDYTLAYKDNINEGTASVIATGIGNYEGSMTATFEISKKVDPANAISNSGNFKVTAPANQTYTGLALTPEPSVVVIETGKTLTKDVDYILAYKDNIEPGTATIVIAGQGNYTGQVTCNFKIIKDPDPARDISNADAIVVAAPKDQIYTGSPLTPAPTVTIKSTGEALDASNYTLAYINNVEPGNATVEVKAIGDSYVGSVTVHFQITKQEISWNRLAGGTAIGTMREIVNEGWQTSDYAIVATKNSYQDALAAAGLAGLLNNAPVLITDSNTLTPTTSKLLTDKKVETVIIVGGEKAVSLEVKTAIEALKIKTVRLGGGTAVGTANEVYKYGVKLGQAGGATWGKDAIIATIDSYQDALSIAPYAYAKHAPIFLTSAGKKDIATSVQNNITTGAFTRTLIIGGKAAVLDSVKAKVPGAYRIAGGTAYGTSKQVATFALGEGMIARNTGIACGTAYQDALTGAALCGKNNSILLLADDNKKASKYALATGVVIAQKNNLGKCYVFGGKKAVSDTVMTACKTASK